MRLTVRSKTTIKLLAAIASFITLVAILGGSGFIAYDQSLHQAIQKLHQQNSVMRSHLLTISLEGKKSLSQMHELETNCDKNTVAKLQAIAINDTKVSVSFIHDNNATCSNIGPLNTPFLLTKEEGLRLTGPITVKGINEPAFILSYRDKQRVAGLIYPQSVLLQQIDSDLKPYMLTALYAPSNKHVYIFNNALTTQSLHALKPTALINTILTDHQRIKVNSQLALIPDLKLLTVLSSNWVWDQIEHHIFALECIGLVLSLILIYFIYRFTKKRLSLISELKYALRNNEFIPHYQPVISLESEKICGVECLIRWQPPGGEMIFPNSFIETLINTDLIVPITHQLIRRIILELHPILQKDREFHVAINLTPKHFDTNAVHQLINQLCSDYDILHSQIIFELTEQNLVAEGNETAKAVMTAMREDGYTLALDDFGTGYSNLAYLQQFQFDYLKIDRQFVIAIGTGAITENLSDSIITLAKSLNLKIIAEGIDTPEHVTYLKQRGVELAQGFYYAKPLSLSELNTFYHQE